jgi:hypothetical protein
MGGGSQIKICISPPPPRSLKQSQLTPIHVKCKQAGRFMQKYDRARGELLLYTDQPRMMNGCASVSNCISILCCIANKEDASRERAFLPRLSGCLCFCAGHVRKRLVGEKYTCIDKLYTILMLVILGELFFMRTLSIICGPLFASILKIWSQIANVF